MSEQAMIDALDPGIRDTVIAMRAAGFETTDSGDGVTKEWAIHCGDALAFPHVFAQTDPARMVEESARLAALLGDAWTIEATYNPRDGVAILAAMQSADLALDAEWTREQAKGAKA